MSSLISKSLHRRLFLRTGTELHTLSGLRETSRRSAEVPIADEYFQHRRLYVMNLGTRTTEPLTRFGLSVWDFEWSPDNSGLVIQASPLPTTDHSYMFKNLYIVDAGGSDIPQLLTETEGKLGGMAWSPDGKHIAWHGAIDISDPTV
jgi:dipeptidyl aminopeptidase/acylaminoacyl peptidase